MQKRTNEPQRRLEEESQNPQPAEPTKSRGEPVAKVRERGFVVVDGRYVPTVLVEFPIDDWESRDRFADMVCAPQPAELATKACNLQPTKLVTISEIIPSDYSEPVKVPSDEDIIQLFVDMVQKDEIGRPVMDISMKEAIEVSRELLRRYGNTANPRPTDDELLDQALRERDAASEMADKLANAIAKHLGVEIGEHTSSNHPWYRALDAIEVASAGEPVAWIRRETLLGMHKAPQMNIVLNRVYLRCSQVYEDEVPLFLGPQPADHFADVRKMLPSDAEIREVLLANGFTIKPGQDDLKEYVYEAARALLARYGAQQNNKETQ